MDQLAADVVKHASFALLLRFGALSLAAAAQKTLEIGHPGATSGLWLSLEISDCVVLPRGPSPSP